jgi:hypothetical protein
MPLEEFTPGWNPIRVGVEGDRVLLHGANLWKLKWVRVAEEPVIVPHPTHPHERHLAWVYEVEHSGKRITFAAGELSNGVWGFYVPA